MKLQGGMDKEWLVSVNGAGVRSDLDLSLKFLCGLVQNSSLTVNLLKCGRRIRNQVGILLCGCV